MRRVWTLLLTGFSLFIVGIIVLANNGRGELFFKLFSWIPHYDKVGHFVLMGILAFLNVGTLAPRFRGRPWIVSSAIMAGLLVLIALEELSQHWIANRSFSAADYLCSAAGVLVFGIAAHFLTRARASRELQPG